MKMSYGTLICHVFLYKRIQGLIRKYLVLHWAHPACKCVSILTLSPGAVVKAPSTGTRDEYRLQLRRLGRGRQAAADRN